MSDTLLGDHRTPVWAFQPRTRYGRVLLAAYQVVGLAAVAQFKKEDRAWTLDELLERAAVKLPDLIQALDELSKAPREGLIEKLGIDPATLTDEQHVQVQREMLKAMGLIENAD